MPLQTSSDHSVRRKTRITNKEIWSSVMDEIATMREDLDYLKTVTQNTFCVMQRMENYNLLTSNNMFNQCQNIQKYSCLKCEAKSEPRRCKKLHAVKSLINIENKTSVTTVSLSSAESSMDSLLTSFIEQKSEPDETDCVL